MLYRLATRGGRYYSGQQKLLHNMLELATVVVAGNEWLRDDLGLSAPTAVVIPTAVSINSVGCKVHQHRHPVTLGWIGGWGSSVSPRSSYRRVWRLQHRFPGAVELKIVSSSLTTLRSKRDLNDGLRQTEDEAIDSSFDIGLMPVHNDPFSHGKCAFKAVYVCRVDPSRGIACWREL